MNRTTLIATLLALAGCAEPQPPQVDYSALDAADRPYAKQAWLVLLEACPGLVRYADDITDVKAEQPFNWMPEYQVENYGWDAVMTFRVIVTENPGRIPARIRASGHHLRYNVGSGDQPGIDGYKPQGRFICDGQDVTDLGSNWFKPAAGMAVVARLKH